MSDVRTQGDSITEEQPIKVDFYRVVDNLYSLKFTNTLSFCLAEEAPEALNASKY